MISKEINIHNHIRGRWWPKDWLITLANVITFFFFFFSVDSMHILVPYLSSAALLALFIVMLPAHIRSSTCNKHLSKVAFFIVLHYGRIVGCLAATKFGIFTGVTWQLGNSPYKSTQWTQAKPKVETEKKENSLATTELNSINSCV